MSHLGFRHARKPGFDSALFATEGSAMITRLLHTRYRVNDLEKTATFYKNVLGLIEVSRHSSPRGSTLAFFKAPGSEELIEICHYPKSGPVVVQPDLTHLGFEVDDLEAFAKKAAAKGYPLSDGPTVTGSGSKIAFIDGPEGYEFELIEKKK
jgi:lactoylglutathione lyase